MKAQKKVKHLEWRTNPKERISYYFGDIARNLEGNLVQTFMTTYLMLSGINLAALATVTLVLKCIDAFDNLIFGYLIDKLKPSHIKGLSKIFGNGKYLPWYRAAFWIFPVAVVLFFQMPQNASDLTKIIYFSIFYLLYDLGYTIVEIPLNSAIVTITDNSEERNVILTNRTVITVIVTLIMAPLMSFMISEKVGMNISTVVLVMSVVYFFMMLPMVFLTKEHNANVTADDDEKYTLKDMILNVKNNKYLLLLLGGSMISAILSTGQSISLFTSYYLFGSSTVLLIPMVISIIPIIISQKVAAVLCNRYEKFRVCIISQVIHLILRVIIYFVGYNNIMLHIVLTVLAALPMMINTMSVQYMMLDCIEYGKYRSGKDCAGISFALSSFIGKLTASVAASLGLIILGLFGWVTIQAENFADLAEKNIAQPASAINGLWVVNSGVIIIGIALSFLFLAFYKLKSQDVKIMTKVNSGEMTHEEANKLLSRRY